MRNTGNFNLEWGYLAPAPSFLRSVQLVVVAATIAATASAAVVFALVRQPAAEASVAARTLVPPVEVASAPKVPVAAVLQTQSGHASTPGTQHAAGATQRENVHDVVQAGATSSAAGGSGIASTMPRAPVAAAVAESSRVAASASPKAPNKKTRVAAQAKDQVASVARPRVALAQNAVKPTTQPLAHNVVRNSVVPDSDSGLRDDDSLLARTMGVTDNVIAATQRAVSTIGVIPTWVGSIGNRLGG